MLIDELVHYLRHMGFYKGRVDTENIYLFEKNLETEDSIFAVLLFDFERCNFSSWEYLAIRKRVIDNYRESGNYHIELLAILCGSKPQEMKEWCALSDFTWMLDTAEHRIVLFENQTEKYSDLRLNLESFLEDISQRSGIRGNQGKRNNFFSPINTIMIVINVLVFLITDFMLRRGEGELLEYGALFWPFVAEGQYYRLFTYMFLHSGIDHILNNMIVLLFIGDNLERAIGKWKYLLIYFLSGIFAGLVSIRYNMWQERTPICVGASGAIFGVCGAVAYLVIINRGKLEDLSRRQIVLFVMLSLYGGLTSQGVDNAAHIGGLVAGVLLAVVLYRRPRGILPKQEERSL